MQTSLLYRHPLLYRLGILILYNRHFSSRYKIISGLLPDNADVIDVCCGDCYINKFLEKKKINYLGLDLNHRFVKHALKRGIKAQLFDLENNTIPKTDYIIMQGSLYQFAPRHRMIIDKLISAANKGVIISERIRKDDIRNNLAMSYLSNLSVRLDGQDFNFRFTKKELLDLFNEYHFYFVEGPPDSQDVVGFYKK